MSDSNPKIIGARWLVPVDHNTLEQNLGDSERSWLEDCGVVVNNGRIEAIAPYQQLVEKNPEASAQFYGNHILLPGLVNGHGHAGMSLLRGFADDQPLKTWLEKSIWPQEAKWASEEFVELGAELAIAEMLLSGTTTFADMYFFPDATARVAERSGLRAQINFPVLEFANNWAADAEQHINQGLALSDSYRKHERIQIGFAPHAPYTVSNASFERVVMLAEEIDAHIQLHLQETAAEVQESIAEHGHSPVQRLNQLGVLSARTQAVHMTCFDEDDLSVLQQSNTSVIHCPASNLKLASGYSDIQRLLDSGIAVGLGTDSAASNNRLSSFDSLRLASLLAKQHGGDATRLDAATALYAATLGGAEALGIADRTGSISIGKQADMIAVDCSQPALQPVHNPVSQLVYCDCSASVDSLWVDGRQLLANGELLSLDSASLQQRLQRWQESAR